MDSTEHNIHDSQSPDTQDTESSIDWIELISVLWASRKLIAAVTGIATIGVIISLFLPE